MPKTYLLPSGHKMEEIEGHEGEKLMKDFVVYKDGVMRCNQSKWILPTNFKYFADLLYTFGYHSSDVIVLTYPKSGTTWTQEIVWNLIHNPDLNNPAANLSIDARSPSLHGDMLLKTSGIPPINPNHDSMVRFKQFFPGKDPGNGLFLLLSGLNPPPRLIKTHIPLTFLPPDLPQKSKIVYVARDPRDVVNSLYYFFRLNIIYGFKGNRDEFIDYFINDQICYGPYWKHVEQLWEMRDLPNVLFLFYEDLISDIEKEVRKIDAFLETKRTDEQIQNIIKFTTFDAMKERSKSNPPSSNNFLYFNKEVISEGGFFRKGQVDDWKNNFTEEQTRKVESWMKKNLVNFGSDFKYTINRNETQTTY